MPQETERESFSRCVREQLNRALRAVREEAGADPVSAVHTARKAIKKERALLRLGRGALGSDGWPAIDGGLMRTYRDGRRAMREASRTRTLEALHDWRKRVKDLWYELRLLAPVCGPAFQGAAAEAGELADILGDDHDLGVLRQTLLARATEPGLDLEALIGLIDYRREQLETQAVLIGERLYAESPGAFRRRIR